MNPCYKCEERHQACAVNCKKWAEYVKEREEVYKKRQAKTHADFDYRDSVLKRKYRQMKEKNRNVKF